MVRRNLLSISICSTDMKYYPTCYAKSKYISLTSPPQSDDDFSDGLDEFEESRDDSPDKKKVIDYGGMWFVLS